MDRETTVGALDSRVRLGGLDGVSARVRSALRWAAMSIILLISAETFARLDDAITWKAPLLLPYRNELLLTRDSNGMRGRPGYRYQKWAMNRAGFRGAELAPLAPGKDRIAILGASETFGLFETEGKEYPARLQTLLDSVVPSRYEVINVALPGMGLPSMDRYYRKTVAPLQPRFVLVYPSPSFYLEPSPPADAPGSSSASPEVARFGAGFFESRLLVKLREVVKQLIPSALLTSTREWRLSRLRASRPDGWTWQTPPEDRLALFRKDLERIIESISSSGATPVLVTHTNRFIGLSEVETHRERRHLVNLIAKYYPRATESTLVEVDSAANLVMRELAQRHGALVIEAEGRIPHGDQYFADYAHFTDAGADVMAHLIARALLSNRSR